MSSAIIHAMVKRTGNKLFVAIAGGAVITAATLGAHYVIGGPFPAIIAIIGFLVLVWRLDNATGAFLPLAVLFVVVLAILAFLLGALAFVHRMSAG